MAVANTLAYYDTATVTTVKSSIVQVLVDGTYRIDYSQRKIVPRVGGALTERN